MNRLSGKVAIVTGSTQGLGEGIARRFAQEGAKVVVNGRSQDKGEKVVDALKKMGADAVFIRADLTDKQQAQQLIASTIEHFGALDILVNNAQIVPKLVSSESPENDPLLDAALSSGAYASLWTAQAALPWFIKRGGGRIINFGSLNGVYGSKYGVAYNTTKEGIRGLTKTLANEWGQHNVTVNVVLPSGLSPAYEAFYGDDLKKMEAVAKQTPMRRHGLAQEDIGGAVLGLACEYGRFITGQTLFIDGGQNLLGLPQLHTLDQAEG